jgi:hypothetical protein
MSALPVSAKQSVKLFGWGAQPILTLSWNDVKQHHFTCRQLRALGLEAKQLQRLQPDKHEWLQRGGIQVLDLLDMTVFQENPLTDFGVDLAELWQLRCSGQQLASMGVTFDHLLAKGISPEIMAAFCMPLSEWSEVHFSERHALNMSDSNCQLVFGLAQQELLRILRSFARDSAI